MEVMEVVKEVVKEDGGIGLKPSFDTITRVTSTAAAAAVLDLVPCQTLQTLWSRAERPSSCPAGIESSIEWRPRHGDTSAQRRRRKAGF